MAQVMGMTKTYQILVHDGYRYEYRKTVEAETVPQARKIFLATCAPSERKFKVSELKAAQ
jgi:hypothetical protein